MFLLSFLGFPSAVKEEVALHICQAKDTAVVHILQYFGDHVIVFPWLPDHMSALQIAEIHDFFFSSVRAIDKEHATLQASLKMHTQKSPEYSCRTDFSCYTLFYVSEGSLQLGCKKRNIFTVV